ncbi:hypothetical protein SVIOM342S_06004 [Streptomyces violaceorubidus]
MTLLALHSPMSAETWVALVFVQRPPLPSTTRTVLAPLAAMSAMELVRSGTRCTRG